MTQPSIPPRTSFRRGFTLIELSVVLVITALLATVAILKLQEPYELARFQAATERLLLFEEQVRDHAMRYKKPGSLRLESKRRALVFVPDEFGESRQLSFDASFRGVALYSPKGTGSMNEIRYSEQGTTPIFAFHLKGDDRRERWVLFTAVGQVMTTEKRQEFDELRDAFFAVKP